MRADDYFIERYLEGNVDAVDMLIDKYKNSLYRLCYHLTRDKYEADDLFQDTWMKLFSNIHKYKANNFKGFLFKICINTYKDFYRKKKRNAKTAYLESAIDEVPTTGYSVEKHIEEKETKVKLMDCVNKLKDNYRIPIILHYFHDCKYEKIADIMKIPIGTVKSRISTAKDNIRKSMEVELNEY